MIRALAKQDPVLRGLNKPLAVVVTVALFTGGLRLMLLLKHDGPPSALTAHFLAVAAVWLPVSVWLFVAARATRGGEWSLALPVAGARVWLAHVLARLQAGALMLALGVAGAGANGWVLGQLERSRDGIPGPDPLVFAPLLAGWLAVAVAAQACLQPGLVRPRGGRPFLLAAALAVTGLALATASSLVQPWGALVPWPVAALLVWLQARRVPPALALMPGHAEAPRKAARDDGGATEAGTRAAMRRLLWHVALGGHGYWALVVVFVAYGYLISGAGAALSGEFYDEGILLGLVTVYLLFSPWKKQLAGLGTFDALPLSRRRLFAVMTLPGMALVALGYAGGLLLVEVAGRDAAVVSLRDQGRIGRILVPMSQWRWSRDGAPAPVVAPWGEAHAPAMMRLGRSLSGGVYNPWSAPADASPEFVAWQLSRAVADLGGPSMAPEELASRFEMKYGTRAEEERDSVLRRRELARALPGGAALPPLTALAVGLLYLGCLAALLRAHAPRSPAPWRSRAYFAIVAAHVISLFALLGLMISHTLEAMAVSAGLKIAAREVGAAMPGGGAALWVLVLLALWLAYRGVEALFLRAEAPLERATCAFGGHE